MTGSKPPRLLGGYGPAIVVGVALVLIAIYVPSVATVELSTAATAGDASATMGASGSPDEATGPGAEVAGATTVVGDATANPAPARTAAPGRPGGAGGTTAPDASGASPRGPVAGQTVSCGPFQVQGDPYAPPCYRWGGGSNGGATSKGVTADTITVSIREGTFDKGVIDAVSRAALRQGASNFLAGETPELIRETIAGLIDYFNARYEFYGRKLRLQWVRPKGDVLAEVLGGGQEGAEADAITVANEVNAFADISGISPPYADALSRRGVIAIGAPYMSRQWLRSRAPYQWSWFTDCNTVVDTLASYYAVRLGGRPAAYARGALDGSPRRVAVVAPDSDWFQQCVQSSVEQIRAAGFGAEATLEPFTYRLDLNAMAPQAYSLVPQLVSNGVTTVLCACDPLMLLFLTAKAREQGYQPEWVETGVAFSDQDAVAQLFDQATWDGAFGVSFAGEAITTSGGPGYRAFKSARPNGVPSKTVEALFFQVQLLAIGVQMAGPRLDPKSFEAGMFRYPERSGPAGTWTFGPDDYTATGDAREVYYSAHTTSSAVGNRGAWIDPSNGARRHRAGQFPPGDPVTGR